MNFHETFQRIFGIVGITCTIIFFSGCGGVTAMYKVSAVIPNESYKTVGWETVKISVPDLAIHIRSSNNFFLGSGFETFPLLGIESFEKAKEPFFYSTYYLKYDPQKGWVEKWPIGTLPPYFYVEILFDPKENGYTFDPKNTILIMKNKNISASAFLAPEGFFWSGDAYLMTLFPHDTLEKYLDHEQVVSENFQLRSNERRGFAIKFGVQPPEPGDDFAVKIEGLKRFGKPVDLPLVRYHGSKEIKQVHY